MRSFHHKAVVWLWVLAIGWVCTAVACAYAEEITIVFSGDTHGMLYPCTCPHEPDGGVARRAALVEQWRMQDPNMLLLDSGGFFAGGVLDDYSLSVELDKERSRVNYTSMNVMKYDGAAIGDDEFNFTTSFLEETIKTSKVPFLSCNLESEDKKNRQLISLVKPYITKEVAGIKIGIIGVTPKAAQQKAVGIIVTDPLLAVKNAVKELKAQQVSLFILLSHLGEQEDVKIIKAVPELNIVITGHIRSQDKPENTIDGTLLLRPSWQGRRLGKVKLTVQNKKILASQVEEERLSSQIVDSPSILTVLPRCFSDMQCKKEGLVGVCQNPGALKSNCVFTEATAIPLTIVTAKNCSICAPERVVTLLKKYYPGLVVSYLDYPDAKAAKLVKEMNIVALPVFLLGPEVEKEKNFSSMSEQLEKKGQYYLLKPQSAGYSYFINRPQKPGALDLFISLYDTQAAGVLDAIKDFNPAVHFLATETNEKFEALRGQLEVEDYLRSVCVQKHYPKLFWSYISCRAKKSESSWWEDCLAGIADTKKIISCARGAEGKALLKANIALNRELKIMLGPTYLMDNQQIFGIQGVPKKEELRKIFKK